MRILLFSALLFIFSGHIGFCGEVKMTCSNHGDNQTTDIKIDMDKRLIYWGAEILDIANTDDAYIKAYSKTDRPDNGMVCIINRSTGSYTATKVVVLSDSLRNKFGEYLVITNEGECHDQSF